jgi:hypothetical protein
MVTFTWWRRRYVALSLFANMENIRLAKVTGKIAKGWARDLYFVGFQEGRTERLMGWAVVRDVRTGASAWNEDMRAFRSVYAAWHEKGLAEWHTDKKYLASEHQPVQLTTVYAVRAATELRSAENACSRGPELSGVVRRHRRSPMDEAYRPLHLAGTRSHYSIWPMARLTQNRISPTVLRPSNRLFVNIFSRRSSPRLGCKDLRSRTDGIKACRPSPRISRKKLSLGSCA